MTDKISLRSATTQRLNHWQLCWNLAAFPMLSIKLGTVCPMHEQLSYGKIGHRWFGVVF